MNETLWFSVLKWTVLMGGVITVVASLLVYAVARSRAVVEERYARRATTAANVAFLALAAIFLVGLLNMALYYKGL